MKDFGYPKYPTQSGYMTEKTRRDYISAAVSNGILPKDAHRMAQIVSLDAPNDPSKPIQFWQLYSVLGQDPIVQIVLDFYQRVFADEDWFRSVFARVGGVEHHVNTQAAMWIDVMGGGPYYHGADFRLSFHHTHNAVQLMTDKGAERWASLLIAALEDNMDLLQHDDRLRPSINTFLTHFMGKYAQDFAFEDRPFFGQTNPPYKRKINFLRMTEAEIQALPEAELAEALQERGVDVSQYSGKDALVSKALML